MGELYYGERVRKPWSRGTENLINALKFKDTVVEVKVIDEQILKIMRKDMYSDILLYIVDAYVLGEGATLKIISDNPQINAILVVSNWNEYTHEAKELARLKNIAVFTFKELMGAIYYNGEKFINYKTPEHNNE
ncbi:hypothetical protein [Clostridium sp. C2-6-12]|uniref:hypothetical protein n=1 Tax=Clostridium sp. C2-6-12 TaxID=2698832 RepID=UPI001368461C|nr:hypothetical protein [Clostridium sp. C2-6-12]